MAYFTIPTYNNIRINKPNVNTKSIMLLGMRIKLPFGGLITRILKTIIRLATEF